MDAFINAALQEISMLLASNRWLAPALAVLAGMLTSVTPCSLSSIPLAVAYVGGSGRRDTVTAFKFSLVIAAGMAITFTALGALAALVGRLFNFGTGGWWFLVLGVLMIAMALQTWGIITVIPSSYAQSRNTRRGYIGAFLIGILGGLFSSPCATPVLIALLALVSKKNNPLWGIMLLLLYSIGHSILLIIAGTFMGLAGRLTKSTRYDFFARGVNILLGTGILAAGLYFLYLGF
ncbi:MAG: cytochrome C biogenesis protein [Spirochaetes bacterium GWB1_59_5]|nr:MAG: cytochrome C biogenesis protein [Spirochaetes bacterium GWB1_59_5]